VARPSDYTQDLADRLCSRLSEGESMRAICRDDDMPDKSTVFRWLRIHAEFRDQYARAKEESTDAMFEDLLDIADDGSNDWMERYDSEQACIGWRENGEALQRSKLRVDARKWALSKLKPKKYGDKLQQEISGPDGGPVSVSVSFVDAAG
jgi:hypothetical protein